MSVLPGRYIGLLSALFFTLFFTAPLAATLAAPTRHSWSPSPATMSATRSTTRGPAVPPGVAPVLPPGFTNMDLVPYLVSVPAGPVTVILFEEWIEANARWDVRITRDHGVDAFSRLLPRSRTLHLTVNASRQGDWLLGESLLRRIPPDVVTVHLELLGGWWAWLELARLPLDPFGLSRLRSCKPAPFSSRTPSRHSPLAQATCASTAATPTKRAPCGTSTSSPSRASKP